MLPTPTNTSAAHSPSPHPVPAGRPRKRIFIVDDHPVLVQGIRILIEREHDFELCGHVGSAPQALSEIGRGKGTRQIAAELNLSIKTAEPTGRTSRRSSASPLPANWPERQWSGPVRTRRAWREPDVRDAFMKAAFTTHSCHSQGEAGEGCEPACRPYTE